MKKRNILKINNIKKGKIVAAFALMAGLFGCADNPDESLIKNKDFDNMLEEATNGENSVSMDEMEEYISDNYDSYKVSLSDDNLNVNVEVDAKVDIPTSTNMSVYRVMQKDISQEFLDKLLITLAPDTQMYNGNILNIKTKAEIETEIKYIKDYIAEVEENSEYPEDEKKDTIARLNEEIKMLEELYENAPKKKIYKGNESSGKFECVWDKYSENNNDEYYAWQYGLTDEDDEIFYAINDAADGNYISLYAQNNTDYGNVIRYNKNSRGYAFTSYVYTNGGSSLYLCEENDDELTSIMEEIGVTTHDIESLTISMDDAKKEADKLINDLGLADFECEENGVYVDIPDLRYTENLLCRKLYKFTYLRNIEGVFVNNNAGSKHTEEWSSDDYVKKTWSGESITILVNDSGVVDFCYCSPISIKETVVEDTQLKNFEEVKGIFEEMVVIANGTEDNDTQISIDIDEVVLRYTRISEKDNFDTGLLVPVWDFMGTKKEDGGDEYELIVSDKMSILMINAIDGSIIDTALGY